MDIVLSRNAIGNDACTHTVTNADSQLTLTVQAEVQALAIVHIDPSVKECALSARVEERASLELLCVQSSMATQQMITQKNSVAAGATVHCRNITLGQRVEHALESTTTGDHAVSSVDWIAYAREKEKHVLSARNTFEAPYGGGEITFKSVAEESATVVCTGMIAIGEAGRGTDTYLTEDVLMLDPTCVVDAIPGLEIKTNDVKASHSATISRVTETDLFTFGARGIAPAQARQMFLLGFLGQLLDTIPNASVREQVMAAITAKTRPVR